MSTVTIEIRSDDLKIETIIPDVVVKKSFWQSFLETDAIAYLIQESDTEGWEKDSNELQPDEFYNTILSAIADHYAHRVPVLPGALSAAEILKRLIDDLQQQGYLKKILTDENGDSFSNED